jgi:hypothetical protein
MLDFNMNCKSRSCKDNLKMELRLAPSYAQCQDTVPTMNRHTKQMTENQRFVKLKEVQADTQSQRFCTTFNFTQTHNSTSNFYKKH